MFKVFLMHGEKDRKRQRRREEEFCRFASSLTSKMEEGGGMTKQCRQPLETGKGKARGSTLELPEGRKPC